MFGSMLVFNELLKVDDDVDFMDRVSRMDGNFKC